MNTAGVQRPKRRAKAKSPPVPKELIDEMVDGQPIYYRGYQQVVKQQKAAEDVMGSSVLQAQLVALIVGLLVSKLDLQQYVVTTNELGFFYAARNWRVLDIAVFERDRLKNEVLSTRYVKTVPKIVIEVDTKADLSAHTSLFTYVTEKTDQLLEAGVEKVIWIFTDNRRVLVAEPGKQWGLATWADAIPVIENISLHLEHLMKTVTTGINESS